jgi:hypothetical protein
MVVGGDLVGAKHAGSGTLPIMLKGGNAQATPQRPCGVTDTKEPTLPVLNTALVGDQSPAHSCHC